MSASNGPRPLTFALLRLLADGSFHSGAAMAAQLGVSRAGVNLALKETETYGLTLHRVRGRGYCLPDAPEWLSATAVGKHLGGQAARFRVAVLERATSSNSLLMQQMAAGAPSGTVLAVEWQSAGRGRLGRAWLSGLGNALTFSLLWRFERGLAALSGLSLAAGLAIVRALESLGVEGAGLKWPNDVLDAQGAKLAGVLVEAQGEVMGPSAVVIGVGLNLRLPETLAQQIGRPAAGLADLQGPLPDRNRLLAVLLLELARALDVLEAQGFAALRTEWEARHALQDRVVCLALPDGRSAEGIARGVSDEGALLLETAAGLQAFHGGEISLNAGAQHAVA